MNLIIFFSGSYLIYIAVLYAFYVLWSQRKFFMFKVVTIFSTTAVAWMVADLLKNLVESPRPNVTPQLIFPNDIFSFPSDHATFMFALAVAIYSYDKYAGVILFLLAIITGMSRVLAGVHFWYDIVGGLLVGVAVALISIRAMRNLRG